MAFGPIIRIKEGGRTIELAPITKEDSLEFIKPGMQQHSVHKYLAINFAPVAEDELEWFEKVRTSSDQMTWGIWLVNGKDRELIGNSTLTKIRRGHTHEATSGSIIHKKEYWGQGIASAAHKARTWFAFQHLGLHCIYSDVIQGNIASRKALEKSGYVFTHTRRNELFIDGRLRHLDRAECVNPLDSLWEQWWGEDRPPKHFTESRKKTEELLSWAKSHVELL